MSDFHEIPLSFATRDVPFWSIAMTIGYHVAQLERGQYLRIHLLRHHGQTGEVAVSRSTIEQLTAGVEGMIERLKLNAAVKVEGSDILIALRGAARQLRTA
jgi:hypothetical protein